MSLTGRLHLDEVISSVPELGPTIPDGGYSWIILVGAMAIQITVPSITSMYGIVLGYLSLDSPYGLDLWDQELVITPILFTAFLCLADPWSRVIVNLASVPRLIGLIGVCLLSIGVMASGYLATGGVGAYLASSSAGAVMGIGGSFILVQTECILRRNFRARLRLALTLKEVATSLGFVFAPGFVLGLLTRSSLHIGLLLMACSFIPAGLGTLTFRSPVVRLRTSPYTLLISEEDNELTNRVGSGGDGENRGNNSRTTYNDEERSEGTPQRIFREGNDAYNYQDADEDNELFSARSQRINVFSGFKQKCQFLKSFRFWVGVVACAGSRAGGLFLWILLPSVTVSRLGLRTLTDAAMLSVAAGLGTFLPNAASYWQPSSARCRSFCFGGASWLGSLIMFGLSTEVTFPIYMALAFFGGVSVGGSSVCLESALLDAMGNQTAKKAHTILSTIVGLCILAFSFIRNPLICLQLTAVIQFVSGSYWILVPLFGLCRTR